MIVSLSEEFLKDKSLNELIKERQQLMFKIMDFENKYILKTKELSEMEKCVIVDPSPTVVWRTNIESLENYNKVIDNKTRDETGMGIDF